MSGGRIASVVIGSLVAMTAAGLLLAGATLLVTDRAARHDGALTSGTATLRTSSYAITSDQIDFGTLGRGWSGPDSLLGDARLSATSTNPTSPVFVGVGPADQVAAYLSGTGHAVVKEISDRTISYTDVAGGAPSAPPARASGVRWVAQSSGTGTQSIAWPVGSGRLTVVVMNADGSSGVDVRANVGATLPLLGTLATGLLAVGVLTLLIGAALVVVPLTRAPS